MFKWSSKSKAETNKLDEGFAVEKRPKSIVAEAYRTLRTNIQYSSFDKEIKTIVVTSADAEEGKSTVSGNLALSFAQNEKKVIIVDCDLRKPTVHKKFKLSNIEGLSEVLIGKENLEEAIKSFNKNLDVLPSGKIPPNPAEMLSSAAMTNLIEILKERYDIVILDSAPLRAVTDAQVLSVKADGAILVVRAERTTRDAVVEAKNLLDKVGANIIGSVLYATDNVNKKYSYYYGIKEETMAEV